MENIFLSYARNDLSAVLPLAQSLAESGISVWRDQESIYGGQLWPKAIGEAIASNDAILLMWSVNSARSKFVEFEWNTAIALQKKIIPCPMDDTALPP